MVGDARWIIDGLNVIGSRPDGWWHDREGAMRDLVTELHAFGSRTGDAITVVFDGRPFALPGASVEVVFAPGRGPGAADDEIVRVVERSEDPGSLLVVTSDKGLIARVEPAGARTESAGAFLRRLAEAGIRRASEP